MIIKKYPCCKNKAFFLKSVIHSINAGIHFINARLYPINATRKRTVGISNKFGLFEILCGIVGMKNLHKLNATQTWRNQY
jgi:hypothetical protein